MYICGHLYFGIIKEGNFMHMHVYMVWLKKVMEALMLQIISVILMIPMDSFV